MAKKKGDASLIDGAVGADLALAVAAERNAENLAKRLVSELSQTEIALEDFLAKEFNLTAQAQPVEWCLASGQVATFVDVEISYADLKDKTFVRFDVNGRDQAILNAVNLSDLDSLTLQQYFPIIGVKKGEQIEILDGSRRRMRALLAEGQITSLRAMVTDTQISEADAKALAKSIQTAKEHSLYETGLMLIGMLKQTGLSQKELAAELGMSTAKVSRAVKAAAIDKDLIQCFNDVNSISVRDYKTLEQLQTQIGNDITEFIELVHEDVGTEQWQQLSDEHRLTALKKAASPVGKSKPKETVTLFTQYEDSRKFARKRVKDRNVTFEFGRMPKETINKIEAFIAQILQQDVIE